MERLDAIIPQLLHLTRNRSFDVYVPRNVKRTFWFGNKTVMTMISRVTITDYNEHWTVECSRKGDLSRWVIMDVSKATGARRPVVCKSGRTVYSGAWELINDKKRAFVPVHDAQLILNVEGWVRFVLDCALANPVQTRAPTP